MCAASLVTVILLRLIWVFPVRHTSSCPRRPHRQTPPGDQDVRDRWLGCGGHPGRGVPDPREGTEHRQAAADRLHGGLAVPLPAGPRRARVCSACSRCRPPTGPRTPCSATLLATRPARGRPRGARRRGGRGPARGEAIRTRLEQRNFWPGSRSLRDYDMWSSQRTRTAAARDDRRLSAARCWRSAAANRCRTTWSATGSPTLDIEESCSTPPWRPTTVG